MFQNLQSLLAPAVMERLTLVINHVLASESVATDRLRPHAGRRIALTALGWPALLPPLPPCVFRVTPAGLLEWCGLEPEDGADLWLRLDASNPAALLARAVAGEMPAVTVDGDAVLAGDINWLLQNLRWDVAADLERVFGPAVAQQLHRLGSALARALRGALQGAAQVRERLRPRP
jgi:ubiquinone biosynthesis accessory factor UbiJ